jgi:hypothetical protein
MKILDIIIPHETLDETAFTDLVAKGRQKAKDVANDVGELTGIRALRTRESNKIADYVDNALTTAGKDLKRSDGLAAAEKELLALEKNISLEGLSRKRFDEMAEYLATRLAKEDRTLHSLESPIVALQGFIKNEPNPQAWMNSRQIRDNLFNNEYQTWLTKNANARVKVKQEVELAAPADPKAVPKTKAEKEEEKIADKDRENRKKQTDLEGKRLDQAIANNDAAEKTFASRFKMTLADEIFIGSEVVKIYTQYQRSRNYIDDWEKSGQLPADVVKFFPPVPPDLKAGSHITGGDNNDTRTYVNEQQRVKQAASWARTKLAKQVVYQVTGGTIAFVVAHGAAGLGGGIAGGASKWARAIKLINLMSKKSKSVTDPILKMLGGMTQAGKYMFADYFLSAVNNEQWNSHAAATAVNAVLPDYVYKDLNIDHTADINKAVGSLVAENFTSLEAFGNSDFYKQVHGAVEASYVPLGVIAEPLAAVGMWIWKSFSLPDVRLPPAEGEVPGVGDPVKPLTTTTTTQEPPKPPEQVNPQVTDTSPPAPPEGTDTTNNNKIKREKLEETLKYKVLSRMRS